MKTKVLLIVVIAIIASFGFVTANVSAETPMDAMSDSCICNCGTHHMQTSMPGCCSMTENSFPDCSFSSALDDEAVLPGRSTLNWDVCNCQFIESVSSEIDIDLNKFPEKELPPILPSCIYSEYHCRNSLNSEASAIS